MLRWVMAAVLVGGLGVLVFWPEQEMSTNQEASVSRPMPGASPSGPQVTPPVRPVAPSPAKASVTHSGSANTLVSDLVRTGQTSLTLESGNTYALELRSTQKRDGVDQHFAMVDPNGTPGFAMITVRENTVLGTFNTPEGVYEMFGTLQNFQLRRARDIDGVRRMGTDYLMRDVGIQQEIDRAGKTLQIR